jgi:hypothetical protein
MKRLLLISLVVAMVASCGGGEERAVVGSFEIDETYRRGPVSFRAALSRKEITIAERVTMLLEIRAREGYRAELPSFGEKLELFGIVDYETFRPELQGDTVVTRRTYELEPFLSGEYAIPPMTVRFTAEGDSVLYSVESDTLRVRVNSILPEDLAEFDIRDAAGPVDIPADYTPAIVITAAVLAAAAAIYLLWRRRSAKTAAAMRVPAHEIAYRALEKLLARGLIEKQLYKEFTAEVADILRRYIEGRFGLRAPERTTEEFLIEAREGLNVEEERKRILAEFLVHCDLVKFASLEPGEDDVKRTFATACDFIEATKPSEEVREAVTEAA